MSIPPSRQQLVGLVLVIGAAVIVALAILYTAISSLRVTHRQQTSAAD